MALRKRRHRGGSPLPMNPEEVSSFVSKTAACTLTACGKARFRDRSRPCFISTDRIRCFNLQTCMHQIVAECARSCSSWSGPGLGRSFRCKAGRSQFLFEFGVPLQSLSNETVRDLHGAMTKGTASEATLFSLQNEERRVQSHRFSPMAFFPIGFASCSSFWQRQRIAGTVWALQRAIPWEEPV